MAMRKCPECSASVKLENLDRHFASVHPGVELTVPLSEAERRALQGKRSKVRPAIAIKRPTVAIAAVIVLLLLLVGVAATYFPRTATPGNTMVLHIHPQLRITIDGGSMAIPANIGIDPALWRDHALDAHGMEGMSPMHTHDATGTIHVESRTVRDYTLGEFFRVWGQSFDGGQVLGHPIGPGHRVRMLVDGAEMAPTYDVVFRDGMVVRVICDVG